MCLIYISLKLIIGLYSMFLQDNNNVVWSCTILLAVCRKGENSHPNFVICSNKDRGLELLCKLFATKKSVITYSPLLQHS